MRSIRFPSSCNAALRLHLIHHKRSPFPSRGRQPWPSPPWIAVTSLSFFLRANIVLSTLYRGRVKRFRKYGRCVSGPRRCALRNATNEKLPCRLFFEVLYEPSPSTPYFRYSSDENAAPWRFHLRPPTRDGGDTPPYEMTHSRDGEGICYRGAAGGGTPPLR